LERWSTAEAPKVSHLASQREETHTEPRRLSNAGGTSPALGLATSSRVSFGGMGSGPEEQDEHPSSSSSSVAVLAVLRSKQSKTKDFDQCLTLARKHNLAVSTVREKFTEFNALDTDGSHTLNLGEFQAAIRKRCTLQEDAPIPEHLLDSSFNEVDKDGSGLVNFEEYLLWTESHAFNLEMLVPDPRDRFLRLFAREQGWVLTEVEKVKKIFDSFDADDTGIIEENEFRLVIAKLIGDHVPHTRLRQYWLEACGQERHDLDFEAFTKWYGNVFLGGIG